MGHLIALFIKQLVDEWALFGALAVGVEAEKAHRLHCRNEVGGDLVSLVDGPLRVNQSLVEDTCLRNGLTARTSDRLIGRC